MRLHKPNEPDPNREYSARSIEAPGSVCAKASKLHYCLEPARWLVRSRPIGLVGPMRSRRDSRMYCAKHAWEWAFSKGVTELLEEKKQ